jgi:hypothetical protein
MRVSPLGSKLRSANIRGHFGGFLGILALDLDFQASFGKSIVLQEVGG